MHRRHRHHHPDVGLGEPGQIDNLAKRAHAHLDHGVAMLAGEPQERERHAEVIVEVALGLEHRAAPAPRRIAASISLVVVLPFEPVIATTCNPVIASRCARASLPSACTGSSTSITARDVRVERRAAPALDHHAFGARRHRLRDEVMSVEASPLTAKNSAPAFAARPSIDRRGEALARRAATTAAGRRQHAIEARMSIRAHGRSTLTRSAGGGQFLRAPRAPLRGRRSGCLVLPTIW